MPTRARYSDAESDRNHRRSRIPNHLRRPTRGGVAYLRSGEEEVARAEREIVLCAGAFNSPHLRTLSGLGPADEMLGMGSRCSTTSRVSDEPPRSSGRQALGSLSETDHSLDAKSSEPPSLLPLSSWHAELQRSRGFGLHGTRPDLAAPDMEIIFLPVLWFDEGLTPPHEHGFTLASMLLKPRSRGQVTLRSRNPLDAPIIGRTIFPIPLNTILGRRWKD